MLEKKNEAPSFYGAPQDKLGSPVAAECNVPASTLFTILKQKGAMIHAISFKIAPMKNNLKITPHEKLDEALFAWFKDMRAKNVLLSGEVTTESALFRASPGVRRLAYSHRGL